MTLAQVYMKKADNFSNVSIKSRSIRSKTKKLREKLPELDIIEKWCGWPDSNRHGREAEGF